MPVIHHVTWHTTSVHDPPAEGEYDEERSNCDQQAVPHSNTRTIGRHFIPGLSL